MTVFVSLVFALAETADRAAFERDLRAMAALAEDQRGYVTSKMGPSMEDPLVYLVMSEWDSVEDVRAWEHDPVHEEIQHKWEPHFREPLAHRRWTPWIRPTAHD
jgi:heme-degrading monooxygenase HmoA